MDPRLEKLNETWKELTEQASRLSRAAAQLKELESQYAERQQRVEETGAIYRKEQDTAPAKHEIGTIGEFGEIAVEQPEVTANDLLALMRAGKDITADDKTLKKELKELNKTQA